MQTAFENYITRVMIGIGEKYSPSAASAGMNVSAGGLGVVKGQTRSARPATIAAPRAVLSIISGRIYNEDIKLVL